MEYIYENKEKLKLESHIEKMKTTSVCFQYSYEESIKIEVYKAILKWHNEGIDIIDKIKILKHDMLSD